MLKSDYADQTCSIARALEYVGERWTLLIIREALLGTRRFDDYQARLGIARNVLQARLERLVDGGIVAREPYSERPPRYEYKLTAKGIDLWPVIVSLLQWGDKHEAPDGPPVVLEHRDCGGKLDDRRRCLKCGAELERRDVISRRGPGARDTGGPLPPALLAR
ncbi:MAG: winged helix-turn-helix transcriptional regulator [Solirubrobacteraceae bacterium]